MASVLLLLVVMVMHALTTANPARCMMVIMATVRSRIGQHRRRMSHRCMTMVMLMVVVVVVVMLRLLLVGVVQVIVVTAVVEVMMEVVQVAGRIRFGTRSMGRRE